MEFHKLLNKYCDEIGCTNQELADLARVSKSLIGRYKNGERTPGINGDSLKKLSHGLEQAALSRDMYYDTDQIYDTLISAVIAIHEDRLEQSIIFSSNLNYCMDLLSITNADLARFIHMDSSLVSRIRRERRQINDIDKISVKCARYVFVNCLSGNELTLSEMLSCEPSELRNEQAFLSTFTTWLQGNVPDSTSDISGFLDKLDSFDLNEYIKAIKFDELRIPTIPVSMPTSKKYFGIEGMRNGTLDFLKSTALSGKADDVLIYNDLPMSELAEDMEFSKKWMFGLAAVLKKGLHINTIHCLDRPFHELMLGLESWIPLYMTGQISPHYLKERHNSVFCKAQYSSGSAILTGECINGHMEDGMYSVSKKSIDVEYGLKRARNLLEKAHPLMNIYRKEDENKFLIFRRHTETQGLGRKGILCCPPLYTMSEELLTSVMERNAVDSSTAALIMQRAAEYREGTVKIFDNDTSGRGVSDVLGVVSEADFEKSPVRLHLADICVEWDISYTYEEYSCHLAETRKFAEIHSGYSLELTDVRPFDNIQIFIYENKTVCLSKNNAPIINFIIRYPKLVEAFENMMLPVV